MDAKRAQQILQSEDTIPVHFEGNPIWIEEVDEARGTARVDSEINPGQKQTVPVERLEEGRIS
ncbi:H-type small acid-soluble spore protein [Paenibacillus tarimensis]